MDKEHNTSQGRRNVLRAAAGGILAAAQGASYAQGSITAPITAAAVPPLSGKLGMRLATCTLPGQSAPTVVVVADDGRAIDLQAAARQQHVRLGFEGASMLALIKSGNAGLAQVHAVAERAFKNASALLTLNQSQFLSPIPNPDRNIYCVGWNYLDHFEEGIKARLDKREDKLPDNPVFFTKGTHTMNGPYATIPLDPTDLPMMKDWEAELAVVIGRRGKNISEAQAMDHVFGYAAYNDTTERMIQQKRHGGQWFKGKSLDGHGPMGPWIVTAAGVKLDEVRIICRVNGVEKQNASYQQMYFKIPRIIAELSRGMTLEPGDIIATGTPAGVGFGRQPQEFMQAGDVMETEITGIGTLRNVIKSES